MKYIIIVIIFSMITSSNSTAYAYENIKVHPMINDKSAYSSYKLDDRLKNNLEFSLGLEQSLSGVKIIELLRIGGREEDVPALNGLLHFHDSLKPWEEAGFWEDTPIEDLSESSILWSQKRTLIGNQWSWPFARKYYYLALTAHDRATRESYFANTFRAIGQVMHLLADSAVPAHTRNDLHVFPQEAFGVEIGDHTYETWTRINFEQLNYAAVPVDYSLTMQAIYNDAAPIPISAFWDLNQYDGTNPERTLGSPIGLAEYTNANFFSEDTIFRNYPNPNAGNTNLLTAMNNPEVVDAEDGQFDSRVYVRAAGANHHRLAAFSYIGYDCIRSGYQEHTPLVLDDKVYTDYANLLVPKAVGYASGLLDYFFRGTLEISAPDQTAYGIADGALAPQQFNRIKAKVRNTTPNEQSVGGTIQAVARYHNRSDYQPDLSADPPNPESREAEWSYSVSQPVAANTLGSLLPTEFTFDFSSSPIPAGITDLYLHVVFKGTLGNEWDDAIAVGMKDISEPMHVVVWNATDRFYLERILRTSEEIQGNPQLFSLVDHNGDGTAEEFIAPYDLKTDLAFATTPDAPATYTIRYDPAPPGRYGRIILLTDPTPFYMHVHRESLEPEDRYDSNFLFSPVVNQENAGRFERTDVDTFRGVKSHQWTAFARYYPDAVDIQSAPWSVPAELSPIPMTTSNP